MAMKTWPRLQANLEAKIATLIAEMEASMAKANASIEDMKLLQHHLCTSGNLPIPAARRFVLY